MAFRITTYEQAFEQLLRVPLDDKLKRLLARMEREGHPEKSVCFVVWKRQNKLMAFRNDPRFLSVLENEINKWSWKRGDPRWDEYWKRKKEEARAKKIRDELAKANSEEHAEKYISKCANRPAFKTSKGFVYFVQGLCGGAIKIGYSHDPVKRIKELQTGYPDTLTILLMIPGDLQLESQLHTLFADFRLKGEWFRPEPLLIDKIKELQAKYAQAERKAKEKGKARGDTDGGSRQEKTSRISSGVC